MSFSLALTDAAASDKIKPRVLPSKLVIADDKAIPASLDIRLADITAYIVKNIDHHASLDFFESGVLRNIPTKKSFKKEDINPYDSRQIRTAEQADLISKEVTYQYEYGRNSEETPKPIALYSYYGGYVTFKVDDSRQKSCLTVGKINAILRQYGWKKNSGYSYTHDNLFERGYVRFSFTKPIPPVRESIPMTDGYFHDYTDDEWKQIIHKFNRVPEQSRCVLSIWVGYVPK